MLDITTIEGWLWEAACKIRGDIDAPKYKDYILPLIFLKRLSDVFEDEIISFVEASEPGVKHELAELEKLKVVQCIDEIYSLTRDLGMPSAKFIKESGRPTS